MNKDDDFSGTQDEIRASGQILRVPPKTDRGRTERGGNKFFGRSVLRPDRGHDLAPFGSREYIRHRLLLRTGRLLPSCVNIVVAPVAEHDEIFFYVFAAFGVLLDVVKLKESEVVRRLTLDFPPAGLARIVVALVHGPLHVDVDVPIMRFGVRGGGNGWFTAGNPLTDPTAPGNERLRTS